ncbi:MAG: preprotein translocase subunit SecG [Armatimonadetes bacterium]|nr:preprotein translocase subunit SecG [Armatimonadota bacterium]
MNALYYLVAVAFYGIGISMMILIALQTSKSEGLSGILAGGGGGGGKVGREKGLEAATMKLAYGWLALAALMAWMRHLVQ